MIDRAFLIRRGKIDYSKADIRAGGCLFEEGEQLGDEINT